MVVITPRPYQSLVMEAIKQAYRDRFRAPLLVMPTGAGKTYVFSAITHGAVAKGNRVLILAHRVELIDQISDALSSADVLHGIIAAGYEPPPADVQVASVQTLVRRLDRVQPPTLIIIDECHHVANGNTWSKVLNAWPDARRLGVTATPVRADGRGLGENFDRLVCGPTTQELIDMGFLAKPRIFAPPTIDTSGLHVRMGDYVTAEVEARADKAIVTGDALAHYRKHADGKPAIVFCASVKHAEHVAASFRDGGYSAVSLNGGSGREFRRMAIADYRRGALQVLASADIFSEGFDVPGIHAAIMLRPTSSEGLYLQQVGRALRTAPGKSEALIFDHAGNCQRFGLPTDARDWHLTYDETTIKAKPKISVRVCPKCWAASSGRSRACTNCGHEFPVESREVDHRDGELVELTPEQIAKRAERMQRGRAKSLQELEEFGRMKGYASGWAAHVWQARQRKGQRA